MARVLVVDDDALCILAITRLLKREHEVENVPRASLALARIVGGERFDVLLVDIRMPGMTGSEFYREVSRLVPEQAARIVFVSAVASMPDVAAFLNGVPNPWVEKPFDSAALQAVVRRVASQP